MCLRSDDIRPWSQFWCFHLQVQGKSTYQVSSSTNLPGVDGKSSLKAPKKVEKVDPLSARISMDFFTPVLFDQLVVGCSRSPWISHGLHPSASPLVHGGLCAALCLPGWKVWNSVLLAIKAWVYHGLSSVVLWKWPFWGKSWHISRIYWELMGLHYVKTGKWRWTGGFYAMFRAYL